MRKASFKTFLAASAICMIAMTSCCGSISGNGETSGTPKYIFLFIGDGMGAGHAAVAESYLSYKEGKLGGEQLCFSEFPVLGTCTTYSADHQITCSSAAGTAISCGAKTNNGYLGVDPQGNELKSIAYELKDNGYKIGIMSSVPVNHATPAAFYGHNTDREDYYSISMEIPESGFDFFGGSGFLQFNGKNGKSRPTPEVLEENGPLLSTLEGYYIPEHGVYGMTVKKELYGEKTNIHIYYDDVRASEEKKALMERCHAWEKELDKMVERKTCRAEETKKYIAELEEDIVTVDGLIAFARSEAGAKVFGADAPNVAKHGEEIKAAGAKYCDCPACAAVEAILSKKAEML